MGTHRKFRLRTPTIALRRHGDRKLAVILSAEAIIQVTEFAESHTLAKITYKGESLEMFSADIKERGEPVFEDETLEPCAPTIPKRNDRCDQLVAAVDSAHREFDDALAEMQQASRLIPDIGIGSPDGTLMWKRATERYKNAEKSYRDALRRLSTFLLNPPTDN